MAAATSDTKARLLAIGRDLYLDAGTEGFSLREVARRAKISAPAVYRHFDGKEALLAAVCNDGFRVFSSYLIQALEAKTPAERLRATAEQYLRFGLENPRDYRFIFMTDIAGLDDGQGFKQAATFQFLVDRVRECVDAKLLMERDPRELATIIWANVHGLVSLRLAGHLGPIGDDDAFSRFYVAAGERVFAGLAP